MAQQPDVSLKNSTRPSLLWALIVFIIACALPFILVKSFSHEKMTNENDAVILQPAVSTPPSATLPQLVKREPAPATNNAEAILKASAQQQTSSIQANTPSTTTASVKPSPTTPAQPKANAKTELKTVTTRARDSLSSVFSRLGLSSQTLRTILKENPKANVLKKLSPNQQLQFSIKDHLLEKMVAPLSNTQYIEIYRDGQHYRSKVNAYKITTQNQYITATVQGSLYNTAKRHNIPHKLVQQMTEIFAWDMNFARDVKAGDQFTIIYKATFAQDKQIATGDIVAVSYRSRGKTLQAILHTSRGGHSDYYTPQGASLKNAFNRYPLHFSHISSTFSLSRYHPILRYRRPHKGVDLAAPIGTPIVATGDGHIEIIGRQSGYGNMIKIKHNKTYSTIYGHMLKFQRGLSKGSFVKRGQVIGYVGQTGLASGPHCHYEFHINSQPKNPTTVNLPRGDSVPSREMANFRATSNSLLAQLKLHETNSNRKNVKVG